MDKREEVKLAEKYIELFDNGELPDEKLLEALSLKWFRIRALYFIKDKDSTEEKLVFNRTIGLRDSWAKEQKKK